VQALQVTLKSFKASVRELEEKMEADDDDEEDIVETATSLLEAQKKVVDLQALFKRKRKALGIDGRVSLHKLSGSQFLQL
jgi:outer membrane protein TolC